MLFDVFLLMIANALWGSTDVVGKFAVSEMTPSVLVWTRLTIALVAFTPVLWIRRREIPRSIRGLLPFVGLGMSGYFLNFVLLYHGLRLAPASHATALRVSEALVIVVLSALILREQIGRRIIIGLAAGTIGVILVLDVDVMHLSLFASGSRLGDLLMLGGIFIEAFYTIIGKGVLSNYRPLTATALACFFGWIMLSIFYGVEVAEAFSHKVPSVGAFMACAYLGLFASVLAFWIYYIVLSKRSSHRVGISIMLQPTVGIPLAALMFRERMTPGFLAGAACIAVGVYLALGKNSEENSDILSESELS